MDLHVTEPCISGEGLARQLFKESAYAQNDWYISWFGKQEPEVRKTRE
jgi:hypothetical protein